MPYIMDFNRQSTDKFSQLEERLGISDLTQTIRDLNESLDIPHAINAVTEVSITEEDFLKVLDRMSQNALNDPCTLTNPRNPSVDDIKTIYKDAFYGNFRINE